eukprot:COSAG01_NODE_5879_length_3972_cov_7.340305_1_plen_67_part_10
MLEDRVGQESERQLLGGKTRIVNELATEHHGITNKTVWAHGHSIEAVLGEFIADCVKLQEDGGQLAA